MRAIVRTVTGVGCVTAALLFAGPGHAQQMSGGTGTFSGGSSSGGSSRGGGGGGGSNSTSNNFSIDTQEISQGIVGQSLLGGFDSVGQGGSGRSSTGSAVSASNPLAAYYVNPLAQGLMSGTGQSSSTTTAAFGSPLYGNLTGTGTTGTTGRGTSSAFGGTASSGLGSFGGVGSTTSRGGTGGLSGTATIRGGTTGTIAPGFNGGVWGPAIGRRGPVVAATLRTPARPIPLAVRRPDLQAIIARSTTLTSARNITVATDGDVIVLTGTVANEDDRRIAENMLRLSPGVRNLRNELQVKAP